MQKNEATQANTSILQRKLYGTPLWMLGTFLVIVYIGAFGGLLPSDDMLSIITIMFAIGIVLYELGERIPIWNAYCGGGALLAFLGAAVLEHYNILPSEYSEGITFFYDDFGFQTLFISLLIVSAVLAVNRKQLLKAFAGYIPAILGGVIVAGIFGVIAGLLVGLDFESILTLYVLPTMGGGNGAGAIPLSEMWEATTGQSKDTFYSQAIAILTLANNFAILAAVALAAVGNKFPKLTGNGELLRSAPKLLEEEGEKKKEAELSLKDLAGGLLMVGTVYAVSRVFSNTILPAIGPVTLHTYAYMVIFTVLLNLTDIIPMNLRAGAKRLSGFLSGPLMGMCMVGIGIAFTDLADLVAVLNVQTLVVCAFVVLGAVIGSGIVGHLFGFYFVESAITAGLCMANRGGSGDLQVLGAANRMQLMSYAAISSRIGGAIVLLIASFVFSFFA